jgi:hypothetical protein
LCYRLEIILKALKQRILHTVGSNGYFSAKYLSAKYYSAKVEIIQPNIIQPNIIQPSSAKSYSAKYYSAKFSQILFSQILFSQSLNYSAKREFIQPIGNIYSAKLRGGWRPKPVASWSNNYIADKPAGALILYYVCIYNTNPRNLL